MSKEQLWLARRVGVAFAMVSVGCVVIGVAVSTSGILQPTVPTGRASRRSSDHGSHILVRTTPMRTTTTHTTGTLPRRIKPLARRSVLHAARTNR